jgi:hypothetical protein
MHVKYTVQQNNECTITNNENYQICLNLFISYMCIMPVIVAN